MNINNSVLKNDEKIIFALRDLYNRYGYSRFKMSKFEEYDLYVRNKDFLISDSIITFTDTNGKLMALKPDVTFSIIKNNKLEQGTVQRYYYNENVYRVSKSTDSFKEIMQTGLECIGDVDVYCITEVLLLAAKSLKTISDDCLISVSYLDFISEIVDSFDVSGAVKKSIYKCLSEKNVHELSRICSESNIDENLVNVLKELVLLYGSIDDVLPKVDSLLNNIVSFESLDNFKTIMMSVKSAGVADIIKVDFSVINNMKYYNGIIFNGFINGVTGTILSGGQYNKMMKKFGSASDAIGFAVYLDLLDRYNVISNEYDVDIAVLYSDNDDISELRKFVDMLISEGNTVITERKLPSNLKCKKVLKFVDGEVITLENNA